MTVICPKFGQLGWDLGEFGIGSSRCAKCKEPMILLQDDEAEAIEYGFLRDSENFGKPIGDYVCSTSSVVNSDGNHSDSTDVSFQISSGELPK